MSIWEETGGGHTIIIIYYMKKSIKINKYFP